MGLGGKPGIAEKEYVILILDLLLHPCNGFQFFRKKGLAHGTYPTIVNIPI